MYSTARRGPCRPAVATEGDACKKNTAFVFDLKCVRRSPFEKRSSCKRDYKSLQHLGTLEGQTVPFNLAQIFIVILRHANNILDIIK